MINKRIYLLIALGALLALLLNLLLGLSTTWLADALEPHSAWIYTALILVFLASVAVALWLYRQEQRTPVPDSDVAQVASGDSTMTNNEISVPPGTRARQEARDQSVSRRNTIKVE